MKLTKVLKTWNDIEFKLYVPKKIDSNNKIEVHFPFLNLETGKNKNIKKSTGIDRYASKKIYTEQANTLVEAMIELLTAGWNPISDTYPDYIKLTGQSKIGECIRSWIQLRTLDLDNEIIGQEELNTTTFLFNFYSDFLKKNNVFMQKPSHFTVNDINLFMRTMERKRGLSPVTYNSYLYRLNFFYKFLYHERVINYNPCSVAFKYKTKNLKTRFEIFEPEELQMVRELLVNTPNYRDLLIACKFLFEYNIREAEQLRIKISWINWEKGELTIPEKVIERERTINGTKNGLMAKFQLRSDMLVLLNEYIGDNDDESNFLFGGHYKPGPIQRGKQFLSNRWWRFREDFKLSKNLKLYALKHTGNYESLEAVGIEKLSKMARHASITQTQDYVKSKLNREVIKIDGKVGF